MKKQLLLASAICSLWNINEAKAQLDARRIPFFLNPEFRIEEGMRSRKPKGLMHKYIPQITPEMLKEKYVAPDKILSEDGFALVNMTPYNLDQTETWLAYNPVNRLNLVGGSNDSRYNSRSTGYRMVAYYTEDGGRTWGQSLLPKNDFIDISQTNATNFDPSLAYDSQGRVYYCYGFTQINGNDLDGVNGVFVSRSDDGGKTWQPNRDVIIDDESIFNDRYILAADAVPTSPYKDNVYVVWMRFGNTSGMHFSRSTDGGQTWSAPALLPGGRPNNASVQSPTPAVGPNGEIYLAWRREAFQSSRTEAAVQVSTNGGNTWRNSPVIAQSVLNTGIRNSANGRFELTDKQNMRISSWPVMDVDISNSPRRGRVYLAQSGKDNQGRNGIFLTYSDNQGATWTTSKRIDNNSLNNDVFLPALSVDANTGTVSVFYYSSQNDPQNKGVDGYIAISTDGGETFRHFRLTPESFFIDSPNDISNQGTSMYWGDYTGLASRNGRIYPSFWKPNGPQGTYSTNDVYTALISAGPKSVNNSRIENTYLEPTKGVLTWVDPSQNMFGDALENFDIIIFRNGVQIGTVPKGTQIFTDNSLTDGEEFQYTIIARDKNGLESDPVVITGTAGGGLQPLPPTDIIARPSSNGISLSWKNPGFHTDSSYFHDFSKVEIYSGNSLVSTVVAPTIQSGASSTTELNLPTNSFYRLSLKAFGKRGTKETASVTSDTIIAYAGAPLAQFSTGFDVAGGDSVAYFINGNWGKTSTKVKSPGFSMTDSPTGNYRGNAVSYIMLAPTVIGTADTTLSFDHIALIDAGGDYGAVEVSNDFGQTWSTLKFFDQRRSSLFKENVTTSDWVEETLSLGEYKGDTLFIRFTLRTNLLINKDGWYLDNIRINDALVSVADEGVLIPGTQAILQITPNPSNGNVSVNITVDRDLSNAQVIIFDALGRKVFSMENLSFLNGENLLPLQLNGLVHGGVYYVQFVSSQTKPVTMPIIIH